MLNLPFYNIFVSSQRSWVKQISRIYHFEATAFCRILYDAVVAGCAIRLGWNLSGTTAAYSVWVLTSLRIRTLPTGVLPSIYDYAGAYNAINPVLKVITRKWP